jgi:hypothetical protein
MKKFLTASALALLLAPQTFSTQVASPARLHLPNEEEYAVYSAVISKLFAGNKVTFDTQSPVNLLVIKNRTVDDHPLMENLDDHWRYVARGLSPISQDTIAAYKARNREPRQLEDAFKLPIKNVLVEEKELDRFRREGGWEEFYKKYPESGGFISFSQVGFNPERSQALVYFEHWCGGLCGSGLYLLLEKSEGGWKVAKAHRSWIS